MNNFAPDFNNLIILNPSVITINQKNFLPLSRCLQLHNICHRHLMPQKYHRFSSLVNFYQAPANQTLSVI